MWKNNYQLFLGRHYSLLAPDYLLGAIEKAKKTSANTLTFFLGSPQNSARKTSQELKNKEFQEKIKEFQWDINKMAVHAPYIINLANSFNEKIFFRSLKILKKEIELMSEIGINLLIIHPGSSLKLPVEKGIEQLIKGLNILLHENPKIILALETMCSFKRIGGTFEHFSYILQKVKQPERVGICWDTCHLFAAGYDIKNSLEEIIEKFKKQIGLNKLLAIHINDSDGNLGSEIDRHCNIGLGKIGLEPLKKIVFHPLFDGIPKFLETKYLSNEQATEEIKMFLKFLKKKTYPP